MIPQQSIMTSEIATISKIREQVVQFEEVLFLQYKVPIKLSLRVFAGTETPMDRVAIIQRAVAEYFEVEVENMVKKSRKRDFVVPRQIAMEICFSVYGLGTLKKIGTHFGGRDHSTVIHGCQTVANLRETDRHYRQKYNDVLSIVETKLGTL